MENDAVKQSSAALSTMAIKVLAISGNESKSDDRVKLPSHGKHYESNFHEDFKEHLIKLMLPGTSPLPELNDTNLIEVFGARRIEKNGKILYQFDCTDYGGGSQSKTSHEPGMMTIRGPTFNAKNVLSLVRNKLKDEIWIRDNVVECRTKATKEYHNMQGLVSDCLNEENKNVYNYILCLQQEFRNNN